MQWNAPSKFSYGSKPATIDGDGVAQEIQSSGFFNDWFFNMFAAALDLIHSPLLIGAFVIALIALVVVRTYFDGVLKL
jgi:hypothetical protein